MGQNDHGGDSPDAGNTNIPQLPSQQFAGDGQPRYSSQLIGNLKPMNPPPLQLRQPKNSAKSWIIGCSIAAGVVICLCALTSFALFRAVYDPIEREVDGKAAIQNFCRAIQIQDYVLAYNTLSRAARGRMGTVNQFMTQMAMLDQSQGSVTSCGIDLDTLRATATHSDGKRMDVQVYVSRGNNTSNSPNWNGTAVMLALVFENNVWKVDAAEPTNTLF